MKVRSQLMTLLHLDRHFSLMSAKAVRLLLEFFRMMDFHCNMSLNDIQFCTFMHFASDMSRRKMYQVKGNYRGVFIKCILVIIISLSFSPPSLCLSLCLSVSLYLALSLSRSLSLSVCLSPSVSLCPSLSLSLSLYVSLSLSLSLSVSLPSLSPSSKVALSAPL